jgi:hypothetical protein
VLPEHLGGLALCVRGQRGLAETHRSEWRQGQGESDKASKNATSYGNAVHQTLPKRATWFLAESRAL